MWIERDFRKQHPFLALPAGRQVEELVRFFQTPLARLAKAGLVKLAPARHEEAPRKGGPAPRGVAVPARTANEPDRTGQAQPLHSEAAAEGGPQAEPVVEPHAEAHLENRGAGIAEEPTHPDQHAEETSPSDEPRE